MNAKPVRAKRVGSYRNERAGVYSDKRIPRERSESLSLRHIEYLAFMLVILYGEMIMNSKPRAGLLFDRSTYHVSTKDGEMSEWLKETVLKTVVPATVPWVRIPLSPPY